MFTWSDLQEALTIFVAPSCNASVLTGRTYAGVYKLKARDSGSDQLLADLVCEMR